MLNRDNGRVARMLSKHRLERGLGDPRSPRLRDKAFAILMPGPRITLVLKRRHPVNLAVRPFGPGNQNIATWG
jgi:hypothetical protein